MKTFFTMLFVTGGIIGGAMLLRIVMFPVSTANKLIDTAYNVQSKTLNADNALYNYEWFKQQKEDIEATKQKFVNAKKTADNFVLSAGDRKDWTFEDKTESSRLNSVVLGIENHLEQQIADYNARAKMANRAIFQDGILPNFLDANLYLIKN